MTTCLTTALYVPQVVHVVPIYYQARYTVGEKAGEFMSRGVLLWVASRGRGKSREQASWREEAPVNGWQLSSWLRPEMSWLVNILRSRGLEGSRGGWLWGGGTGSQGPH